MDTSTTCKVCVKKVLDSEDGIQCDSSCHNWFHIKCVGVTKSEYTQYSNNTNKKWHCSRMDCSAASSNSNDVLLRKMDELLGKISLLATKDELKNLTTGVESIQAELSSLNAKINEFEPRLESLETDVAQLKIDKKNQQNQLPDTESTIEEINERKRRSCNVIVHGLVESKSSSTDAAKQHDKTLVGLILNKAGQGDLLTSARFFRIGTKDQSKPRPIKVCLPSENSAISVFQSLGNCTDLGEELEGMSLSRDRTLMERRHLACLRETLKARTEAGEPDLTIKYSNGTPKILKKPKN